MKNYRQILPEDIVAVTIWASIMVLVVYQFAVPDSWMWGMINRVIGQ